MAAPASRTFPDWQPAPNIRDAPELYELENRALDPDGRVLAEMRAAADWRGRRIVDLGCGTGYWLAVYARDAALVVGIEPDADLLDVAISRTREIRNVQVLAGSAEHLPLETASVDVVHARFAYFWGAGAEAGLAEVARVLTPQGILVVVDNDYAVGEFAELLTAAGAASDSPRAPLAVQAWWRARNAELRTVLSQWRFDCREDLEAVLLNEFRDGTAERWLERHPDRRHISYGFALFVYPGSGTAAEILGGENAHDELVVEHAIVEENLAATSLDGEAGLGVRRDGPSVERPGP
jgi:ubiquinone/menaquinone biosynthesis C-methylase UbiE